LVRADDVDSMSDQCATSCQRIVERPPAPTVLDKYGELTKVPAPRICELSMINVSTIAVICGDTPGLVKNLKGGERVKEEEGKVGIIDVY
jgi:hypothetical protein